jgi:hypothetical protein
MKLERLTVLVGLSVTSISVPLCAQPVYYLPQVIDGATAGGSLRSTIVLTNSSTSSATVNVALTRDDGSPLTVNFPDLSSGSQFSVTLKPNGTRILQTDGSSDGSAGAATVSANVPIGVSTIVSAYDASANLVSESGAGNSIIRSAYVIPVDSTLGMKTGVVLFNPNATASALTFTLFDINGTMVEMTIATLASGGHLSRPVAGDLFPDLSSFRGTMLVASTLPVAAVTFRQNASAPGYTLLEAESQTATPLWHYFPQLADGQSGTTTLQTSFFLYNLSKNQAGNVQLAAWAYRRPLGNSPPGRVSPVRGTARLPETPQKRPSGTLLPWRCSRFHEPRSSRAHFPRSAPARRGRRSRAG